MARPNYRPSLDPSARRHPPYYHYHPSRGDPRYPPHYHSSRDDPYAYPYRPYYHPSRDDPSAHRYPPYYHSSRGSPFAYPYRTYYRPYHQSSRHDPYAYGYLPYSHPSIDPFSYRYRQYFEGQGLGNNGSQSEGSTDDGAEGEEHDINGSQSDGSRADDHESKGAGAAADNTPLVEDPPPYGYPDDDGNVPRPKFVLIHPYAYFADRTNATTAYCETSGLGARGSIKVTFCTARPRLVSYLCVHATGFSHTDFAVDPHIVATEADGGLVLLRVVIDRRRSISYSHEQQFFVYDARGPSLRHLPHPGYRLFNEHSFAIVRKCGSRCGQGDHDCDDYVIAAQPRGDTSALCLYHSDTNTWSKQPVLVKKYPSHHHDTSKTITIGGDSGTVAWVDLRHNILLCNVLEECPKLRVVPLPPRSVHLGSRPDINPRSVRDVAFVDGFIKYVEVESLSRVELGLSAGENSRTLYSWKATVWSIKTSRKARWHKDYELESSDTSEPLRVDAGTPQPTLSSLHISLPNLSLQDDGVVYFLAKSGYRDNDRTTWVIAVDMRNKTVQKMDEFNPSRTVDLAKGYDASRISKYLKAAPV